MGALMARLVPWPASPPTHRRGHHGLRCYLRLVARAQGMRMRDLTVSLCGRAEYAHMRRPSFSKRATSTRRRRWHVTTARLLFQPHRQT